MNGRRLCIFVFLCLLGLFPIRSLAQVSPSRARIAGPIDESTRVTLKGNSHPFALPAYDAGVAPDTLPMESIVLILQRGPDKQAALDQLLWQQQDKSSPQFHKWLTPEEFGLRFGPADDDLCAIVDWLAGHGFAIKGVTPGRTLIEFSGTAEQIRNAFRTEMHKYNLRGEEHWANDRDPSIPAALAPIVHGILSLNDFSRAARPTAIQSLAVSPSTRGLTAKPEIVTPPATIQTSAAPASTGTPTPQPMVTITGSGADCTHTGSCYAVGPADFAAIYNVNPVYALKDPTGHVVDGTGQTIAIASSSNINPQDVTDFRTLFSLPVAPKLPNLPDGKPPYAHILLYGPDPGLVPGKEGPATVQVQWAGAIAPNAIIDLVVTQSTTATEGAILSAITAVNSNLAPVLTLSYGVCEPHTDPSFFSFLWEQAAGEGITVVVPVGDTGAAGCDNHFTEIAASQGLAVNAVASTVYNVAVGGTDFDQVGNWGNYWNSSNTTGTLASVKPNTYIPEVAWNDTCAENGPTGCAQPNQSGSDLVASGGGFSIAHAMPSWQSNLKLPPNAGRALPDISLFASDGNNGSLYLWCDAFASGPCNPGGQNTSIPQNIQGGGGTAASAAAFAGIMALVDQYNQTPQTNAQGNANFVLYPLAQNAAAAAFHDVTKGNTSVACVGGSFQTCNNPNTSPGSYGIISDVDGAIWSAAPGYDVATGLGSPDVANLVTKWSTVTSSFQPTTTTITSVNAPNMPNTVAGVTSSQHGQPVSFGISVAPKSGTGTPTGDVALRVIPSPTPAPFFYADVLSPLLNGSIVGGMPTPMCLPSFITSCTRSLPGGSYQIVAHYVGDGTFAPSDSLPVSVTVAQQLSQTTLSIENSPPGGLLNCVGSGQHEEYGAIYYLLVVVGNPGDQPGARNCFPVISQTNSPTGTVDLTDAVNFPGINPNPVPLPTLHPALNGRGAIEIPTWPTTLGQHQITATYHGDSSYARSTDGTGPSDPDPFFFVIVDMASPTLTLSASCPPSTNTCLVTDTGTALILAGTNVNLTATASNTVLGSRVRVLPPSGTVTFCCVIDAKGNPNPIGTASLSPNSMPGAFADSIATLTFAPTQNVTVNAQYSGDGNYKPTTSSVSATIAIGTADFKISETPALLSLIAGKPGNATIKVTPILGFTDPVTLSCPDPKTLPRGMTCAITPSTVAPGADGKPVTATLTLDSQAPSVISASAKPPQPQWMAMAGGSLAIAAMFFVGVWRRNQLMVLSCAVLAVALCVSCIGGKPSAGPSQNSVLTLSTSGVACSGCPAKSLEGSSITLTAAVSADHDVTGTVDFFDNGTQIASGVSLQTGRASFNTIAYDPADPTKACGKLVNVACLLLGAHPITAKYSGDAHTQAASVDTPLNQVIIGSSQLQITATSGQLTPKYLQLQFTLN